jgi:GNAT superfamily N-acetyltransferase
MSTLSPGDLVTFRAASLDDATRCYAIESAAYPADEAATLDKIRTRILGYPEGFLIMELDGEIVGFINSGCAFDVEMSDEEFKELVGHDPAAPNVVIMSVVVDPQHQGQGLSSVLVTEFITHTREHGKQSIHLMCKESLVPMYAKHGWKYTKPSDSTHGGVSWHEMVLEL